MRVKKDYVEKLLNFIETHHLITEVYAREYCDMVYTNGKVGRVKNYKKINKNLHNLYLINDVSEHFDNNVKGNLIFYTIINGSNSSVSNDSSNLNEFADMANCVDDIVLFIR